MYTVKKEINRLLKLFIFLGFVTPFYAIFYLWRFVHTLKNISVLDSLDSIGVRLISCVLFLAITRVLLLRFSFPLFLNFEKEFQRRRREAQQRAPSARMLRVGDDSLLRVVYV